MTRVTSERTRGEPKVTPPDGHRGKDHLLKSPNVQSVKTYIPLIRGLKIFNLWVMNFTILRYI